jgi:hypothetical protein
MAAAITIALHRLYQVLTDRNNLYVLPLKSDDGRKAVFFQMPAFRTQDPG